MTDQCSSCGDPAERTLGTGAYCGPCLEEKLDPIRQRVDERARQLSGFGGRGRQTGPLRLDYGPTWALLECDTCHATWLGQIGEPCDWCDTTYAIILAEQRTVLLHPDLPSPDMGDARRRAEVAWAERLGRAVAAELITDLEARSAIARETSKSADFTS